MEASEPTSPEACESTETAASNGSTSARVGSALTNLFKNKKQPMPQTYFSPRKAPVKSNGSHVPEIHLDEEDSDEVSEHTALLGYSRSRDGPNKTNSFLERQWESSKGGLLRARRSANWYLENAGHPLTWDYKNIAASSRDAFSAVFLGVLLNLLDALSYGMILFPLGEAIFEKTGPDGISMFYVSCIVSQLTYSLGGTAFKGGVGSEMVSHIRHCLSYANTFQIEVVPFFHKMAYMILAQIGTEDAESVLATTITSYAISSILTGVIFLLLGAFKLGNLVSFFPRSLLMGCIGGVGVFLFLTGIEVSAGLDSSMDWGFDTMKRLVEPATFVLWALPLGLSLLLLAIRKRWSNPIVMPVYFTIIVSIFYVVFALLPSVSMNDLREQGWVFRAPEAGVPFYNFYSYYSRSKHIIISIC